MLRANPAPVLGEDFDPFAGPGLELSLPATESQRELWTATRMGPDASCAFNESNSLKLRGPLDVDALREALRDLVERHEALRTTFSPDGEMLLVSAPDSGPDLALEDLSELDSAARQRYVAAVLKDEVEDPFDLERGPLLRTRLLRMGPQDHLLVFTAHHIVCDGWSTAVILRDLARLYSARQRGEPAHLPSAFPFSQYARERLEAALEPEDAEAEAWWLKQFEGVLPTLDLPTDAARPPFKTYASQRQDGVLDRALANDLRTLASRSGTTLFTVLLAGFDVLLQRLSGAEDMVVGVPSAGQASSGHSDLVGHCVNTLPIRARFSGDASFSSVVSRLRGAVLDATERSEYTFGRLLRKLAVGRDPGRLPLVSVLFNLDQGISPESLAFDGVEASFASNPRQFENFDLFLNAVELDGEVRLECQFNTDLFSAATIQRWLNALGVLLRGAVTDPDVAVGRLPMLTQPERAELDGWNATARAYPRELQAHQLVERQARAHPEAVALSFAGSGVTYADLDSRATRLARHLRSLGVESNTPVGVCLERSPDMLIAILAVAKAGGAYVPLDPAFPIDRLAFMVDDSRMPVLIAQRSVRAQLPECDARLVLIDEDRAAIDGLSDASLARLPASSAEDAAYIIYTSGSTGTPKGVRVPHRALVNLLTCAAQTPGMSAESVIVAITTLSFDIATYELWLPLTVGARIALAPREAAGDGPLLLRLLRESRATILQATPATWRLLIQAGWSGGDGLKVISTGEALPRDLAEELVQRSDDVWNMYGPTETTVWSSYYRLPRPVGNVVIGRPMANTQLHILDRHLQPTPLGVPGELYIGGDGVTLGYLNRPELTAERFIADPFVNAPGARLYRTGDQARWRPDGTVDYLGRNDYQVKVRGFRIELGEIEAVLARHATVAEAVAAAREDRAGDVRLVAYVVPRAGQVCAADELRQHLRRQLPEYMLPQHFVPLDSLPLTPNGKVDRKALPAPETSLDSGREYMGPRTDREHMVAQLWQEVLGVGRISVHDDFFQLGGHSLLAAQVVSRLARDHGLGVPMRRMFEAPTIEQFALSLDEIPQAAPVSIRPRTGDGPAPASIMQRRIVLLEQIGAGRRTFNLPAAWRLRGPLDIAALRAALNAFVQRQAATRATLDWNGDDVVQTLAPQLDISLSPVDLREVPAGNREAELMRCLLEASEEPFDLAAGPLVRATLFQLDAAEHVLFLLTHHAIWDGWSFDLFVREVNAFYTAFTTGSKPSLTTLPIQYSDFAAWHNEWLKGDEVARQVAYWHRQLAGDVVPLELPTDRPRTRSLTDQGATEWVEIPRCQADSLVSLGRAEGGVTLYMVLLAAFETLLHRYSGQSDFLVGTPVRGRAQPETEDLVGFFVNTVMIRSRLDGDPTFREVLQRVRSTVLDAFSHQDVPFEFLQMSRNPIYRAFFSFQDARNRPSTLGNVGLKQVHVLPEAAANDLSLWIMENERGLIGGLNYSTDLFDRSTVQQVLASFLTLLRDATENPDTRISQLAIVAADQCAPVATGDGNTEPATLMHAPFQEVVRRTPLAIAVRDQSAELNYADLDARSDAVAGRLFELGLARSARVGILAAPGVERVIGLVAVAKAGYTCVLLDPRQPSAWLERLLSHTRPAAVLAGRDVPLPDVDIPHVLSLDFVGQGAALPDMAAASADDACLVACTLSGGELLAVELSHAAVGQAVQAVADAIGLTASDRFAALGASASGRWALEAWLPLSVGATLVLVDEDSREDVGELIRAVADADVTAIHADPTTWQQLVDGGLPIGPNLLAVASGGPISVDLARALAFKDARAFNLYGQAETGFWTGVSAMRPESAASLGRPLGTGRWYVVDRFLKVVPPGVPGELAVASAGLPGGVATDGGGLGPVFLTGDLVRVRSNGQVEHRGRHDDRLSIRGLRVDPSLIEQTLLKHPGVKDAAVTAHHDRNDTRLIAWVVLRQDEDVTESDLRRHVRRRLPDAMVPRRFIELLELPHRPDGALDRTRLPLTAEQPMFEEVAPRSDAEQLLAEVWKSALDVERVGIHDNFFDLGGHSLLCLQVVTELERRTRFRLNPRMLLLNTLEQVAAHIGRGAD